MRDGDRERPDETSGDESEFEPESGSGSEPETTASLRDCADAATGAARGRLARQSFALADAAERVGDALSGADDPDAETRRPDDGGDSDDGDAEDADGDAADEGEESGGFGGLGRVTDRAAAAGDAVRDRVDVAEATRTARDGVADRVAGIRDDGDDADATSDADGGVGIDVTAADGVETGDRVPRRARDAPTTDLREADTDADSGLGADGDATADADADANAKSGTPLPAVGGALPTAGAADAADVTLVRARTAVTDLDRRLERAFRRADPTETGKWAASGGLWLLAPALAASYPTALVVGAGALGGAAVGAYASGAEETALEAVDPSELPQRAAEGAAYGRRYGQYGSAAGALLGGGLYVAHSLAPEALEGAAAEVDGDSVLRGAAMGAERAAEGGGNPVRAGLAGGGLGALSGYADGADADVDLDDDLADLLDDDLLREYETRVADVGGDGPIDVDATDVETATETEADDRE